MNRGGAVSSEVRLVIYRPGMMNQGGTFFRRDGRVLCSGFWREAFGYLRSGFWRSEFGFVGFRQPQTWFVGLWIMSLSDALDEPRNFIVKTKILVTCPTANM